MCRAVVWLRMTVQELVCVARGNTHQKTGSTLLKVLRRTDPALFASAWRAYGHLLVSQPVSIHRQAAAREHADPLYSIAYEELYWMSRTEHEQKAWELACNCHASQVAAFTERIFSNISKHPTLTPHQKEVLTLDIRSIYNQAYGRRHQAGSLKLAWRILRKYLPHLGDLTQETDLRKEFRIDDGMYIEVTGQAATTRAGVIKAVNRLYAQPENPAVSEQQEWRDTVFQEAAGTQLLIDSDKRFLPMSSSTLFTCEHFRDHQARGLRVEIR